ncbi:RND transporter [Geomonas silvestris]|uniref:RND transporter n=1 Tax=Geomonas silvestris TaxID=2740184 RepID=A0A6V8MEZ5_9BACT|nr:TolC family protein [Geomonas silvestris]GFO58424.1 RND transporter [Geomonas silvestris]
MRLCAPGILSLALCVPAGAQTAPLTLAQLVDYALSHNGSLAALRQEEGIYRAQAEKAATPINPVLDLEAATGALTGSPAESRLSLGLTQEFQTAGKRAKRVDVAEKAREAQRWQLADRERSLKEELKTAFYDTLLAEKRLELGNRVGDLNRQLLEVARERLNAGDIPELELNLVKVELARTQASRVERERALALNRSRLSTLVGLPAGDSSRLAGSLEPGGAPQKSLAELKELARSQRPDLKVLGVELDKGDAELALARAEAVPNLNLGLVLSRDATSIEVGGIEGKDTSYTVGLRLSMPLPLFDRNRAGIAEAGARVLSATTRRSAALVEAEREVESAFASLKAAEEVLALYRGELIPQLEENLALSREAYRLGELGILAVIEEQKKFFEVNDGYLAAQHARQVALGRLEAAVAADLIGGDK